MKKTSRTFKRFAAITSASLLAACMVAPMASFAETADGGSTQPTTYKITINNEKSGHTYEAYQIFVGDLTVENGAKILSDIKWGTSVSSSITDKTAADLAKTLTNGMTGKQIVDALGLTLGTPFKSVNTQSDETYVIDGLAPGYYLIKDKDDELNGDYDANTSYIIEVVGDAVASPKSAFPSVEKEVWDNDDGEGNTGDNNGWKETADHAINESFQFRLTAQITADDDLADYNSYKVVFNDTYSEGVTYEDIASVKVGDKTLTADTDYTVESDATNRKLTITVLDVTDHCTLEDGTTVEVIYNAHLNEKAQVIGTTTKTKIENINTVYLEYSNNPNWTSSGEGDEEDLGRTNEDSVYVATYQILNTKVDGASKEGDSYKTKLEGAVFELYDPNNAKIELKYDSDLDGYRPLKKGVTPAETADPIKSREDGTFNFVGLDAGTYTLKEITPPTGYNSLSEDLEITLTAIHAEDESKVGQVTLSADGDLTLENNIENNKGSSLPSTGGIGTTVFYLGGGAMVAVAGIYLISKKRMKNTQE